MIGGIVCLYAIVLTVAGYLAQSIGRAFVGGGTDWKYLYVPITTLVVGIFLIIIGWAVKKSSKI